MKTVERKSVWSWAYAGFGAVVLAVLLAAVGLTMAIRQVQAVPLNRINELIPDAVALAAEINADISREAHDALALVVAGADADEGLGPNWLPAVLIFDGSPGHRIVLANGVRPEDLPDAARLVGLVAPWLNLRLQMPEDTTGGMRFLPQVVGSQSIVLTDLVRAGAKPQRVAVAGLIDPGALVDCVVKPAIVDHPELMVCHIPTGTNSWIVELGPALPGWAIQPSERFVADQYSAAWRQTFLYVGVMGLVLMALLLVLRGTAGVARRELELSRLKSEFVADVSHELKTPLALIQMFGETLLEGRVRSDEKKDEYYQIIVRESKRLTHLINNILDFSRIDSGKKVYQMRPVRVEDVVWAVYEVYCHDLDNKGFEHELKVAEDLPRVDADADALSQVLLNLISNAIKYSDDDRWLGVELEHETRRGCRGVLLSVGDRGIGIRPEDRASLFDGFFRAPDDRVRRRRGAGLGLAVVREIVEAHGGFVEVESRLVKGTTFRIFLPQSRGDYEDQSNG